MDVRKAMIIGSIGLVSILACAKKPEDIQREAIDAGKSVVSIQPTYWQQSSMVTIADIDGDRYNDVIAATANGKTAEIYLLRNKGDGTFSEEKITSFPMYWEQGVSIAAGDLNADGSNDLLIGTGRGTSVVTYKLMNDGKGNFE